MEIDRTTTSHHTRREPNGRDTQPGGNQPPTAVQVQPANHERNNSVASSTSSSSSAGALAGGAMVLEASLASPSSPLSDCSSSAVQSPSSAVAAVAVAGAGMTGLQRMQARMLAAKAGSFAISRAAYDRAIADGLTPAEAQTAADEAVAAATGKPPPVRATSEQQELPPARTPSLRNTVSEADLAASDDGYLIPQLPNSVQAALLSVPPIRRQAASHSNLPSRSAAEWVERDRQFMQAMCFGVASAKGERAYMEDEHRIVPQFDQLVRLVHPPPPSPAPTPPPYTLTTPPHHHHSSSRPHHMLATASAASSASASASVAASSSGATPAHPHRGLQSFFGVYDGHGGREAAEFVRDNLHVNVAKRMGALAASSGGSGADEEAPDFGEAMKQGAADTEAALLTQSLSRGSTAGAVIAFALFSGMQVYLAHAGDTRAVLCREGVALDLTQDHKPGLESEQSRVFAMGGFIADGCVNGEIGVSRALGDVNLDTGRKMLGLSADVALSKFYLADEDEFVILACDGLWDVMSSTAAVSYARRQLAQHNDIQRCADELVAQALRQQTTDNVSCICIAFPRAQADGEPTIVPREKSRSGGLGAHARAPRVVVPPRPKRLQLNRGGLSKLMAALDIEPQQESTDPDEDPEAEAEED